VPGQTPRPGGPTLSIDGLPNFVHDNVEESQMWSEFQMMAQVRESYPLCTRDTFLSDVVTLFSS
jgi:hypothetical protein